jgi:hypothetical protein
MQRAERRRADREDRVVRTLLQTDYLLGVADVSRLGALRFRKEGGTDFLAQTLIRVPGLVELGRLLQVTERILRDEETDGDLQMIFAPGSSPGGARPKASRVLHRRCPLELGAHQMGPGDAVRRRAVGRVCGHRWRAVATDGQDGSMSQILHRASWITCRESCMPMASLRRRILPGGGVTISASPRPASTRKHSAFRGWVPNAVRLCAFGMNKRHANGRTNRMDGAKRRGEPVTTTADDHHIVLRSEW